MLNIKFIHRKLLTCQKRVDMFFLLRSEISLPWGQGAYILWGWLVQAHIHWEWRRPHLEQHDEDWQNRLLVSDLHDCTEEKVSEHHYQRNFFLRNAIEMHTFSIKFDLKLLPEPTIHLGYRSQSQAMDVDTRSEILQSQTTNSNPQTNTRL